jgi:ribosomal-protein-alanine N-acetyltransferase
MHLLRKMEVICFEDALSDEDIVSVLTKKNGVAFFHKVNGERAGYVILQLYKRNVKLISLGVLPDYRGQGISRKLLEKVKAYLDGQRNKIRVAVPADNFKAQTFFRYMGFTGFNTIEDREVYLFQYKQD